jgi:hypothetical protein
MNRVLLIISAVVSSCLAQMTPHKPEFFPCGNTNVSFESLKALGGKKKLKGSRVGPSTNFVPVNVTIVAGGSGMVNLLKEKDVAGWIKSLNAIFNSYQIFFNLTGTNIVQNLELTNDYMFDKNEMNLVKKGHPQLLQLVVVEKVGHSQTFHGSLALNAVWLGANLMPPLSSMGLLVHELGHWFGLSHTFEYECDKEGDLVRDTLLGKRVSLQREKECSANIVPKEALCTRKGAKQADAYPLSNYMTYAPFKCLNTFTEGQVARMKNMYS